MKKIRHDHFFEESNLTSNIKTLRKALGDDASRPRFIENESRAAQSPIMPAPFVAEKLTTNGKTLHAVISADGKNVVYTQGTRSDRQSVWLRQFDTGNNVEIVPPSVELYYGLALSPDGNFLYFVRAPKTVTRQFDIYRVSIFGGIPAKITRDADGSISISPDGKNFAVTKGGWRHDALLLKGLK